MHEIEATRLRVDALLDAVKTHQQVHPHFWYDAPQFHDEPITFHCWCGSEHPSYEFSTGGLEAFCQWLNRHAECPPMKISGSTLRTDSELCQRVRVCDRASVPEFTRELDGARRVGHVGKRRHCEKRIASKMNYLKRLFHTLVHKTWYKTHRCFVPPGYDVLALERARRTKCYLPRVESKRE